MREVIVYKRFKNTRKLKKTVRPKSGRGRLMRGVRLREV